MNLLDTFAFLFTTNAKQAQKDVESFGASTQKVQDSLNASDKVANKLGLTFSKLALAGVAAIEGAATLGKLKQGIENAIDYNAAIEKTAKLTQINARELAIWNGVVAQAGGNPGSKSYLNFITSLNDKYAGLGLNDRIKHVNQDLLTLSARFKELEKNAPGSSEPLAAKLGIDHDLWLALTGDIQGAIAAEKAFNNTSDQTAKQGLKIKTEWSLVTDQFLSTFNVLEPGFKVVADSALFLATVLRNIVTSLAATYRFGQAIIELGGLNFHGAKKSFNKGWEDLGELNENNIALAQYYRGGATSGGYKYASGSESDATFPTNESESRAFWQKQGYSQAQIAALLANEQAEGGFASNAVGDSGQAKGLFQWHAPRRARILAATGIDVATASHAQQLQAAAWELENTGTADKLRGANSPSQGAAILTSYEAPANASYQAFVRGQSANGYFSKLMGAGQSSIAASDSVTVPNSTSNNQKSVSIGNITIHSQATDAKGIAGDLHTELASTVGAFDDGVKY